MTKDEFVTICFMSGYCKKETALKYANDKDKLTDKDFEEVWRIEDLKKSRYAADKLKFRYYQGAKSTKRFRGGTRSENGWKYNNE